MSEFRAPSNDTIYSAVDGLVRDGTLDHGQADRVYAALRSELLTGVVARDTTASDGPHLSRWRLTDRLAAAGGLLGSGLGLGATLVSAILSDRFDDGFDGESFVVALGVTVALAVITGAVHVLVTDRGYARWFVGGLVGVDLLALGVTVGIAFTDWDDVSYAVGAVMLLAGVASFVVSRSGAAIAVSVLGAFILYASFLADVAPADTDSLLWISVPAVIFGVAVAAAGWRLPSRHVSALMGGVVALGGVMVVLGFAAFARVIVRALAGGGLGGGDSGPDYSGDAASTLTLGVLVCMGLLAAYAWSGHSGYAALGSLGAALTILTGLFALDLDHVLRWAGGVAVFGTAVAATAALVPLSRHHGPRPPQSARSPESPPPPYETQVVSGPPTPAAQPPQAPAPYPSPEGRPPS